MPNTANFVSSYHSNLRLHFVPPKSVEGDKAPQFGGPGTAGPGRAAPQGAPRYVCLAEVRRGASERRSEREASGSAKHCS